MQWQIGLQKNQLSNGGYLTLCISGIILSQGEKEVLADDAQVWMQATTFS
jgi:hypothetical protein